MRHPRRPVRTTTMFRGADHRTLHLPVAGHAESALRNLRSAFGIRCGTRGGPRDQRSDPETHPAVPFRDFDPRYSAPQTNLFRETADLGGQGTGPESRPARGHRIWRDM